MVLNNQDLKHPHYFILMHQGKIVICHQENTYRLPTYEDIKELELPTRLHELGHFHDYYCLCAELNEPNIRKGTQLVPIRQAFCYLDSCWFSVISKGIETLHWDKHYQFCSQCGHSLNFKMDPYEKQCINCSTVIYPRISPSIIVRIQKGDEILLARSPHFPNGIYGLIAGYVSLGESAEDAVIREVREEVGIEIKNIRYYGSQTWPFPDALMLAYTAEYASGELQIDNNEIIEAGWYHHHNFPHWHSQSRSIAKELIDDYLKKNMG